MKTRFAALATALTALAISGATPAAAADRAVTVTIGDLDLSASADRAILDRRIATAARFACDSGARDAASLKAERECRTAAVAEATAKAKVAIAGARETRFAAIALDPEA